jgi:hypothetical protein
MPITPSLHPQAQWFPPSKTRKHGTCSTINLCGFSMSQSVSVILHYSRSILQGCQASVVAVAVVHIRPCEVRVDNRLLRRDAASGVVHQQRLEQIQARVVKICYNGLDVNACPLGERRLVIWERGDTGPVLLVGCAENTRTSQQASHGM